MVFDVADSVTTFDCEKIIYTAYLAAMKNDHLFLDSLYFKNNMSLVLCLERERGLALYDRALYAPSTTLVDFIILQYDSRQA